MMSSGSLSPTPKRLQTEDWLTRRRREGLQVQVRSDPSLGQMEEKDGPVRPLLLPSAALLLPLRPRRRRNPGPVRRAARDNPRQRQLQCLPLPLRASEPREEKARHGEEPVSARLPRAIAVLPLQKPAPRAQGQGEHVVPLPAGQGAAEPRGARDRAMGRQLGRVHGMLPGNRFCPQSGTRCGPGWTRGTRGGTRASRVAVS